MSKNTPSSNRRRTKHFAQRDRDIREREARDRRRLERIEREARRNADPPR